MGKPLDESLGVVVLRLVRAMCKYSRLESSLKFRGEGRVLSLGGCSGEGSKCSSPIDDSASAKKPNKSFADNPGSHFPNLPTLFYSSCRTPVLPFAMKLVYLNRVLTMAWVSTSVSIYRAFTLTISSRKQLDLVGRR